MKLLIATAVAMMSCGLLCQAQDLRQAFQDGVLRTNGVAKNLQDSQDVQKLVRELQAGLNNMVQTNYEGNVAGINSQTEDTRRKLTEQLQKLDPDAAEQIAKAGVTKSDQEKLWALEVLPKPAHFKFSGQAIDNSTLQKKTVDLKPWIADGAKIPNDVYIIALSGVANWVKSPIIPINPQDRQRAINEHNYNRMIFHEQVAVVALGNGIRNQTIAQYSGHWGRDYSTHFIPGYCMGYEHTRTAVTFRTIIPLIDFETRDGHPVASTLTFAVSINSSHDEKEYKLIYTRVDD